LNENAAVINLSFCISVVKFASRRFAGCRKVARFVSGHATTLVTLIYQQMSRAAYFINRAMIILRPSVKTHSS
jgi:hypothetical protein